MCRCPPSSSPTLSLLVPLAVESSACCGPGENPTHHTIAIVSNAVVSLQPSRSWSVISHLQLECASTESEIYSGAVKMNIYRSGHLPYFLKWCAGNAEKIGMCRSIENHFPAINPKARIHFRYGSFTLCRLSGFLFESVLKSANRFFHYEILRFVPALVKLCERVLRLSQAGPQPAR